MKKTHYEKLKWKELNIYAITGTCASGHVLVKLYFGEIENKLDSTRQ